MASYKELAEKYGSKLREACEFAEYTPGRRAIAAMLTEWTGEYVTQHKARRVIKELDLPKGQHTGRSDPSTRIEDHSPNPFEREISTKGLSIKTLDDLLKVACVDEKEWRVTSWRANAWESAHKVRDTMKKVTLHQVKANLERRIEATYRPAEPARPMVRIDHPGRKERLKHAVIVPDLQAGFAWRNRYTYLEPMHDRKAMDAVLGLIREVNPHYVVLLGDMVDFAPWSTRFPRKPEYKQTTQPTIDELHWWLAEIRSSAPGAKVTYMAGNHEERMSKAMVEKLPEATHLSRAFEESPALSVRNLLRLDDLGIEYVGPYGADWWLWDRVRITHGNKVRSGGGATAAAILKSARWSEVYGHIHRVELGQKTYHGPFGRNVITAMSPGCLCRVDGAVPGVTQSPDWQQGCGIATFDEETEHVHMQVLPILEGSLLYDGRVIEGQDPAEHIAFDTGWKQLIGE
ncbi:MAG: hypothetical protein GOVbin1923_4 [Prokaryotic dsDNA virus sp.]|nr:MAG: hypothetical protein GOVbin1923_4 [Prokaryotic dsDNA virus sp.]|tara:strand:- start:3360 stop:4739 length:1380 start_codon:yes stop_codon:yes gene_type:complete